MIESKQESRNFFRLDFAHGSSSNISHWLHTQAKPLLRARRNDMTTSTPNAKCVATTGDTFCKSIRDCHQGQGNKQYDQSDSNLFREAQFSGDGTTIVTHSQDQCLRAFVLPPDLLDDTYEPYELSPYSSVSSPSNIQSYALYPNFDLQDASTTVALSAAKDFSIRLMNILYSGAVHASYPLINPTTEAYISPNSLVWTRAGSHFVAGSKGLLSVFDCSYDGSGPVVQQKTALGRAERKQLGPSSTLSRGGIFTALSISGDGLLAAGTTNREVTIYANEGSGECVASFSVAAESVDEKSIITGHGVMQLAWSPDERYLFVAERLSVGIQVYDMRNTLSRVSWLGGRRANTPQRLGISVITTANGCELWSGGNDGCVRMWKDPGQQASEQVPDEVLQLHEGMYCISNEWQIF